MDIVSLEDRDSSWTSSKGVFLGVLAVSEIQAISGIVKNMKKSQQSCAQTPLE